MHMRNVPSVRENEFRDSLLLHPRRRNEAENGYCGSRMEGPQRLVPPQRKENVNTERSSPFFKKKTKTVRHRKSG